MLTRIAPHLQRVFRYYRSGEFHRAAIDFGKGIDMASGLAFMLINEDLNVIKASAVAELALSSGKVAGLDPLGRIRFVNPDIQSALRSLLVRQQGIRETKVLTNRFGCSVHQNWRQSCSRILLQARWWRC